jgi:ArsR family transcriptional regulator, cadmium/lead-responsive transcriptional repressor
MQTINSQKIELEAKLFRGFSDPSRLAILRTLLDGRRTVSEVVEATGLSQPNTSNHLACLRDCGLVTTEQEGRYAYYSLTDPRIAQLLTLAEEILVEVARGVYECVHYTEPKSQAKRKRKAIRSGRQTIKAA